ncbi:uncharacterized protein Dsimw501_GD24735, isoform B [Drosophila simulans]|nr:uncharacterized protein Dsimw501_GD24735, isoform B [Drosophila simulans]
MATTTTTQAAGAAPALNLLPASNNNINNTLNNNNNNNTSSSNNNNNNVISQPIKIPLTERFSSQTSTGSADSGVIVSSASQQQLQLPPPRSSSGSLSLPQAPPGGKWRQKQQRQQLLLSQDSGIENGVTTRPSKAKDIQGAGKASHNATSAKESGAQSNSSSESLGSNCSEAQEQQRVRASSALELSSVDTPVIVGSVVSGGNSILRSRIKYKSTNSTGTQGFDVEDRIDEVDICDDDDVDCDDRGSEIEEEDDGVNVDDDVEEADNQSDNQSGIIINLKSKTEQEEEVDEVDAKPKNRLLPPDQAELTVAAAMARRRDAKSLATDGHIYFPLLKISEDPHIDSKLINRKDGLQDTMYYLDEFGSPKLREKFARKQKQLLAKQQKQMMKRERRSEEQRKKRNTTVASNLAASGAVVDDTKDDYKQQPHCDTSSRSKHNSVPNPPSGHLHQNHNHLVVDVQEDVADVNVVATSDVDSGAVKMRRHSHDNHYDRIPRSNAATITTRPQIDHQSQNTEDVEQGAEPQIDGEPDLDADADADSDGSGENVKTAKLARTQSCVSWTKVVQKFKNILGKC